LERVKGIEPSAENAKAIDSIGVSQVPSSDYTQIRAQILGQLGPELTQIVATWAKLSPQLKAAVLAIVGSVTSSPEVEP
jgi:hypothetical protein